MSEGDASTPPTTPKQKGSGMFGWLFRKRSSRSSLGGDAEEPSIGDGAQKQQKEPAEDTSSTDGDKGPQSDNDAFAREDDSAQEMAVNGKTASDEAAKPDANTTDSEPKHKDVEELNTSSTTDNQETNGAEAAKSPTTSTSTSSPPATPSTPSTPAPLPEKETPKTTPKPAPKPKPKPEVKAKPLGGSTPGSSSKPRPIVQPKPSPSSSAATPPPVAQKPRGRVGTIAAALAARPPPGLFQQRTRSATTSMPKPAQRRVKSESFIFRPESGAVEESFDIGRTTMLNNTAAKERVRLSSHSQRPRRRPTRTGRSGTRSQPSSKSGSFVIKDVRSASTARLQDALRGFAGDSSTRQASSAAISVASVPLDEAEEVEAARELQVVPEGEGEDTTVKVEVKAEVKADGEPEGIDADGTKEPQTSDEEENKKKVGEKGEVDEEAKHNDAEEAEDGQEAEEAETEVHQEDEEEEKEGGDIEIVSGFADLQTEEADA
ncbi:hypothetical protein PTSG_01984 [Salpingoeca rosetta]|uniref:Uncharacterized protein n=1 Tax=Salpingoeca rosetta (strain ATCC 50818 / BSB-021) TaxID=946362 RepID=F2TZJ1_SALR5|nr:uncharacterized protein PTSG_01984 [Salpingoeca rosetta]EGD79015.1 hypothetical protein PTSG_01984 [Salpingoeca rosetta]|eukprot:XP_004997971.1 hypothetical protein PTSG_01984 [Salpingoeca rosetta]